MGHRIERTANFSIAKGAGVQGPVSQWAQRKRMSSKMNVIQLSNIDKISYIKMMGLIGISRQVLISGKMEKIH